MYSLDHLIEVVLNFYLSVLNSEGLNTPSVAKMNETGDLSVI